MTNTYYGYSKEIHELAETYIARDILCNQTSLVNDMLKHSFIEFIKEAGFSHEGIENYYMSDEAILEYHGYQDHSELAKEEAIQNIRDNGEDVQEPYEWYEVTAWLFAKLKEAGYPVLETDYGRYWGRCATGQAILLDGTFQEIAKQYVG
ncbi:MAG: hypothetical protein DHS20C18_55010 [Saprospiraceae bacterium]|nr:MAG: hypothetical protein DHS20C18_55010 [Saprospiraceae bacterium]